MGLYIEKIACRNFRSYEQFELKGIGGLTLIVGPNAVGKTNLLEGIQLVTACSSFRSSTPSHLVRAGQEAGSFFASVRGDGRCLDVELRVSRETRSSTSRHRPSPRTDAKNEPASWPARTKWLGVELRKDEQAVTS